jgi:hypothetical protein
MFTLSIQPPQKEEGGEVRMELSLPEWANGAPPSLGDGISFDHPSFVKTVLPPSPLLASPIIGLVVK